MNPDTRSPGGDVPDQPQGPHGSTPNPTQNDSPVHQEAAANVIRGQIDALYGGGGSTAKVVEPATPQQEPQDVNPYHRQHQAHPLPQAEQWKEYHSAWQQYYQKYYEHYYTQQAPTSHYFGEHDTAAVPTQPTTEEEVSKDEALYELRQKLLGKVQHSAKKIRKSRHFVPILAATLVVFAFLFVQFNRNVIASVQAYVAPGSLNPQNIVIDPSAELTVSPEPRLIIPKINVDVPVVYGVGTDEASQLKAMEKGVAHFAIPGANSRPGEVGNTVLSGHSSNDLFDQGEYKFIFAQLEKLQVGDTLYANYESTRYTYVITKKEVVRPTEVNKLVYPTDKPVMTLITCTPLGTAIDRLLVTAEQVSPDPTEAAPAPAGSGQGASEAAMPGNAPTFLERLFGR
ncbi:MAG TPA: sortase [Candidatus Saccharimonadaceae bacterium]|nr:sortase [Candidatus Saccharimonadaceae bacterium]